FGTPALGQVLVPTDLVVTPTSNAATSGFNFVAVNLAVSAPSLDAGFLGSAPVPLVSGAPVFTAPVLTKFTEAANLSTGPPVLGTPTGGYVVVAAVLAETPTLGSPGLIYAGSIAPASLIDGNPVLGAPNLISAVAAAFVNSSPIFGSAVFFPNVSNLTPANLSISSPVFDAPNAINTIAVGLTVTPIVGSSFISAQLTAASIAVSVSFTTPSLA